MKGTFKSRLFFRKKKQIGSWGVLGSSSGRKERSVREGAGGVAITFSGWL